MYRCAESGAVEMALRPISGRQATPSIPRHSLETIGDLAKLHHIFSELVCLSATGKIDEGVVPCLVWLPALTRAIELDRMNMCCMIS